MENNITKESDFNAGIVLPIDKPYGWTSSDVVRKVKILLRRLGHRTTKIGHAGTLDPLATGVLLICIGKATKQAEALQAEQKEYIAEITLGATTPSFDLEHPIDERFPFEQITKEAVEAALQEFIGEQEQVPPIYSAKNIDGKRAYTYARAGEEVEMRKANITIYEMELLDFALPKVTIRIVCSKGTYIRSIARDLGLLLNSGGYLSALKRSRSGNHTAKECYALEEVVALLSNGEEPEEKRPYQGKRKEIKAVEV